MSLHAVLCGPDMAATLEFFKICSDGREQPARRDGPASDRFGDVRLSRSDCLAHCINSLKSG
jgi:hypothetical protein